MDYVTINLPPQAEPGGNLNFTIAYEGKVYSFTGAVPPIGTNCYTFHIPSGNLTMVNVMNGSGSYCYQAASSSASG